MAKEPIPAELDTKPPATPPEKPEGKKFDLFHPAMPEIPGVTSAPKSPLKKQMGPSISPRMIQIVAVIGVGLVIVIALVWWIKRIQQMAVESPSPEPAAAESHAAESPAPVPVHTLGDGSIIAASVEDLAKPWSAKKFTFVKPLTREAVDAMVIRLPGGTLWAFALKEPYGKCDLDFVTDLNLIRTKYGYGASHPMVVNSCRNTVYDPLKVGPLGENTWVRGEIVQGGGLRPPISIDVQARSRSIVADRIE